MGTRRGGICLPPPAVRGAMKISEIAAAAGTDTPTVVRVLQQVREASSEMVGRGLVEAERLAEEPLNRKLRAGWTGMVDAVLETIGEP